jgi:hypothetical protein
MARATARRQRVRGIDVQLHRRPARRASRRARVAARAAAKSTADPDGEPPRPRISRSSSGGASW